ncbi:hypothetical protein GYMLUDRAFT_153319 [Collybiopsis luxurians FD-317 M1]|nr:hypothetical protein GYMLUDRAFT_153319 [Collybiopsis luxurians FD-317 M1]
MTRTFVPVLAFIGHVLAQSSTTTSSGQPLHSGNVGQFEIVGDSVVSAQQMFLGTLDKVFIVDKVENNPAQINGHPAWGSQYSLSTEKATPMDVITNSFCAGGNVLGNGTWVNIGGNQPITYGGANWDDPSSNGPYQDPDGRNSIRMLNPCDDQSCNWVMGTPMTTRRWYPTVETLEDGSVIILGGCNNGGFVNDAGQDNPTYEFFPSQGPPTTSPILQNTLPTNLYPLTWLLPSGKLLLQSNWKTVLLDYHTKQETPLDDIPDAVRTYPASAGTVMMPLTPNNNWTSTILFCGGTNLQPSQWTTDWDIAAYPASTSCVKITPDVSSSYVQDDPLPIGRSMANLIFLPNGKIVCLNGVRTGTAGYGNVSWAIGQSFGDNPVLQPVIYDPDAPAGKRWSSEGLSPSTIPRLYHSSAILLPDGSILVSGSNPNSDYNVGPDVKYPTEYRVERFYPSYFNQRRPQPVGLPKQLSYGGPRFDISLNSDDLFGDVTHVTNATVIIIRPGFSTHALNMGQRFVQLESTYTAYATNNTAVLHVNQVPPNPAILAPGPALLFVVVNGVPSVGVQVMIGSGQLGQQSVQAPDTLPTSNIIQASNNNNQSSHSTGTQESGSMSQFSLSYSGFWPALLVFGYLSL